MNAPLAEGDPVLVLWVLTRLLSPGLAHFARKHGLDAVDILGHRARRAVVSSSVIDGVVQARELWFGPNLRPLAPTYEGITWCRGWSREARDALLVTWSLYRSK